MKSLKDKLTIAVMGRSGSGKGTQAKFILARLRKFEVWHIETGRFFRKLIEKKSNSTIRLAEEVMRQGRLFPHWFPAYVWLKELIEKGASDKHLVFDGAPRKVWEAKLLDDVMKWHRRPLPLCVYVEVSEREATKRLLLRGRRDDTRLAIRNRMAFFKKDVLPVLKYYQKENRLLKVNGEGSVDEIWERIDKALKKKSGRKWPSR